MSKTLDEIRKKLQESEQRSKPDGSIYPHWNIPDGTSATVRFLPDANTENTFFWTERQTLKFTFPGIKGKNEKQLVEVQVPCIEMWEGKNTCPVLNQVRPWWKDKSLETMASKYWVTRAYYMQGFVKQSPLQENEPPENPIRKFVISPNIFSIIKAALLDPDMEHNPVDYLHGTDFVINKQKSGKYADYSTSKWARRESSLSQELLDAIDKYGLVDLSTYLPKRPTDVHLKVIVEMFEASVNEELYDMSKWGQYYKPNGIRQDDSKVSSSSDSELESLISKAETSFVPKSREIQNDPPFDSDPDDTDSTKAPATTSSGGKSPQEILQMLRNRPR